MKVVIYGAGNYGKKVLELLDEYGMKQDVLGFADSKKEGEYLEFPIVSIDSIDKEMICIIAMSNVKDASEIYQILAKKQIENIYYFRFGKKKCNGNFFDVHCMKLESLEGSILPQVEMHIMDACNLNCRGCAHYAPIFDKEIPNFEERIRDVRLLKEKFDGILKFYILGGEPFLNPEIGKYVQAIREILPTTDIRIFTNGLLIPKLPQDVLKVIKQEDIILEISEYEPTHRMMDDIKATLDKAEISYVICELDLKQKFYLPLVLEEYENANCIGNGCITIWNGKIARCPELMYIEHFNKHFNTSFPTDGALELENCPKGEELKEYLNKKVPLCKYCGKDEVEWSVCGKNPTLSDFVGNCCESKS